MKRKLLVRFMSLVFALAASAQTSSTFTYQGRLKIGGGNPDPGQLFDFRFSFFDVPVGGIQLTTAVTHLAVACPDGLFTVPLDFGPAVLNGDPRWLQIEVRRATNNPAAPYDTLDPRQLVASSPQSFFAQRTALAENVFSNASLNLSGPVQFNPPSGPPFAVGNTQRVTNLNVDLLDGLDSLDFWRRDTNGGVSIVVEPENRPVEIRAQGNRLLRLEPAGADSPNLIAGASVNAVGVGVQGAVIAGGGGNVGGLPVTNRVDADFGTVGGGAGNQVAVGSANAGVFAGLRNTVSSNSPYSGVAWGRLNSVGENSQYASVFSGERNSIGPQANHATILGGANNRIEPGASVSIIGSGGYCVIHSNGIKSAIMSGTFNEIQSSADHSFLGGGLSNQIGAGSFKAFLGGGIQNELGPMSGQAFIGGGSHNTIESNAQLSAIVGGAYNTVRSNATYGLVLGGLSSVAGAPYTIAAGTRAKAEHRGSIVLADGQYADFSSSTDHEFAVRAGGGVRFETTGAGLTVDGIHLTGGNGLILPASSVAASNLVDGAALAEILDDDGAGSGLDADSLDGFSSENFWKAAGNAGTNPGLNFLGTTDNQALELKVNSVRALRLEPAGPNSVNVLGGSSANVVDVGLVGVTIAGGGAGDNWRNRVQSDFGVIGGGRTGLIGTNSSDSTIAGGYGNRIGSSASRSVISGGEDNEIAASASYGVIAGGVAQKIEFRSFGAVIGGGQLNQIGTNSTASVISGGSENSIGTLAHYSTIGGGADNTVGDNGLETVIAGGRSNQIGARSLSALIAGGRLNSIGGGAFCSVIGGGSNNVVESDSASAVIGGGTLNGIASDASSATISGGRANRVDLHSSWSVIGGGADNEIADNSFGALIGGGALNHVGTNSYYGTIGGGYDHEIGDNSAHATVSGGRNHVVGTNADYSTISGGNNNEVEANANSATIAGGANNVIQTNAEYAAIPGGRYAKASHYGQLAYASGRFIASGDAQTSVYVLRRTTLNATQSELFLDGVGKRMTVPNGSTWTFEALVAARSPTGDSAGYRLIGVVENVDGAMSGSFQAVQVLREDVAAWDVSVNSDNLNDALIIQVTGTAGATIRWVASVRTVEVGN